MRSWARSSARYSGRSRPMISASSISLGFFSKMPERALKPRDEEIVQLARGRARGIADDIRIGRMRFRAEIARHRLGDVDLGGIETVDIPSRHAAIGGDLGHRGLVVSIVEDTVGRRLAGWSSRGSALSVGIVRRHGSVSCDIVLRNAERSMKSSADIAQSATTFQRVGVAGAGAWGTALAVCATRRRPRREESGRSSPRSRRRSRRPGQPRLPARHADPGHLAHRPTWRISPTAMRSSLVAPAQHLRATLKRLAPASEARHAHRALLEGHRARHAQADDRRARRGSARARRPPSSPAPPSPSMSRKGLPTAVTLACPDRAVGDTWMRSIGRPHFRTYWSDDLIGAEAGGAIKNVLAIACGVCEGMGLGRSAHAALIARGFAEMTRLGVKLGGRAGNARRPVRPWRSRPHLLVAPVAQHEFRHGARPRKIRRRDSRRPQGRHRRRRNRARRRRTREANSTSTCRSAKSCSA